MRILDGMPEVEKTSIFGTSVHAVLRSGAVEPATISSRLTSQMPGPVESTVVEPSLEDVFLDLAMRAPAP